MEKRDLDEYMEALWYLAEQGDLSLNSLQNYVQEIFNDEVVTELANVGIISLEGKKITLTPKGYEESKQIVRCHRLAERLLVDVLGMLPKETEKGACEFEHILAPEIVESICTLLGHPGECPHGLKIPGGNCCRDAKETVGSAIVSLDKVKIGEQVKVSYINTQSDSRMHKLTHFGIIPGSHIKVHQRYPSFVIKCDNTQIALEENIAKEIFVFYPQENYQPSMPPRRQWDFRRKNKH
jgi:DtxR family Mn-dependent transcriptional regulator